MSGSSRSADAPATPLRLTSLCQITSSQDRPYAVRPCTPFGLCCVAILLYDLSRSAARAGEFPPGLRLKAGPISCPSQNDSKEDNRLGETQFSPSSGLRNAQSEAEMAQRNGLDERELCIETLPSRRRDPFIKARSAQRHGNAVPLKLGEGAEGGF
jgi:hypothetical protein